MTLKRFSAATLAALLMFGVLSPGSTEEQKSGKPAAKTPSTQTNSTNDPGLTVPDRTLTRGQILARSASAYRGSPYRFGGRSPKTGFDCSGLVQVVCEKWGVYVPRVASDQYRMGKPIAKKDLQAGDLVFFKDTYKRGLSHVGIYLGEGRFVHAATRKKGVIISELNSGYHLAHYLGARRLNLSKLPVPAASITEPITRDKVYLEEENNSTPSVSAPNEETQP